MKQKTMILIGVAVVCGLAASYLTSKALAKPDAPAEEEKVVVLVASKKIQIGTVLREPEKFFVEKQYVKGTEPKKALRKWEELKDKRLSKTLNEEAFITPDDMFDPKRDNSIEQEVPEGMRAVSMKVNAASVVAGFVRPKSKVDVIQVMRVGEHSTALTILQNMLVLATDSDSDRAEDTKNKVSSTVTLAARLEDVQKIRLAEAVGELSLVLRRFEDDAIEPGRVTRTSELTRPSTNNNGPSNEEGATAAPGRVGALPDVPMTSPQPMAVTETQEPAPAPPRTLTQYLHNGERVTKAIFVMNENGSTSTQIEKTGGEPRSGKKKNENGAAQESAQPESKMP